MTVRQNSIATAVSTRPVPTPLLLWLTCGTLGSILFTIVYLIEGATRPSYSALQQAISALSLGPGGWVQQVNFIVFGVVILATVPAWHIFLKGRPGCRWYPVLRSVEGICILLDGIFSQDPAYGYPPGTTVLANPTLHGALHSILAIVAITAMAIGFFILALSFVGEPQWRGWTLYSIFTGIFIIVFITLFGIANGQHSQFAGLFERLSTGLNTLWNIIFLARLWAGTGFGRFNASDQV